MKRIIRTLGTLFFATLVFAQNELPRPKPGDVIIRHVGYILSYNETHEQANWVAYELTLEEVMGAIGRTNYFRHDPEVKTGSATLADYRGSGYDRGHLAPAGDMKWSPVVMSESFYMSNMSPQRPSFNRGIWKRLEGQVRKWAVDNKSVYIAIGGVLTPGLIRIGPNQVSVPEKFYKVILDYKEPELKGIVFILPNRGSKEPLQNYAVTIDKVESATGIDFFYALPDEIEEEIESKINLSKWSFSRTKTSYKQYSKKEQPVGIVNINYASEEELMKLKGIGPVLAERIIQYRIKHGNFKSVGELIKIKGIGPKTLEKLRPYVTVRKRD